MDSDSKVITILIPMTMNVSSAVIMARPLSELHSVHTVTANPQTKPRLCCNAAGSSKAWRRGAENRGVQQDTSAGGQTVVSSSSTQQCPTCHVPRALQSAHWQVCLAVSRHISYNLQHSPGTGSRLTSPGSDHRGGAVVNFYLPERSPCPSLSPPSYSHSSLSFPSIPNTPIDPFFPSSPLEVGPLNPARGL